MLMKMLCQHNNNCTNVVTASLHIDLKYLSISSYQVTVLKIESSVNLEVFFNNIYD